MSKQDDTQPGNSEHDEQSHPADNPGDPHSEDGSETLMDPGLVKPFDSEPALSERDPAGQTFELPSDPTVFEDTSQAEQATLADLPLNASHDRSSATIAGNLVDDVAAESELDDRTTVEPELPHAPTAGFENEHSDATIVQSAKPGDSQSADEISNADGTQVSHAAEDVDRTTADSVRSEGSQGGTVPDGQTPDHDATIIEGVSADPDMTIVEGATGADNSSNTGPTAVDRSDSREASGAGNLEKTRDANEKKQHPAGKGVHETANRWDFEQRYQLVNNFARGGLGQIWMANDSRLRREVAYKELLPTAL
ncbi:MAG: hypothetical protein O3B13_26170, partial [Planctomycetota bacterium]|nr:hypothetical protein [Planctomycetota bacterium]